MKNLEKLIEKLTESRAILYFSFGTPDSVIIQRLLCMLAQVDVEKALEGKLTSVEWERIHTASKQMINGSNIYIYDSSNVTLEEIADKCRNINKERKLDCLVLDSSDFIDENKNFLDDLANELDIVVLW